MQKTCSLLFTLIVGAAISYAQTTAMDFTMNDCYGKMHNLYSELGSGNVVIMEFTHPCPACADAAKDITPMYQNLVAQYGNKVRFFVTKYDDSDSCSEIMNWINTNGIPAVPFDSGGAQTAYYGWGMPTIVVAAGSAHKILYIADDNVWFSTSDTTIISAAIRNFLDSTFAGVQSINTPVSATVFPNPVADNFLITIETKESGILKLELTNITGGKVAELMEEKIQAGIWRRNFAVPIANGVYFIKGSFSEQPFQKKITVLH